MSKAKDDLRNVMIPSKLVSLDLQNMLVISINWSLTILYLNIIYNNRYRKCEKWQTKLINNTHLSNSTQNKMEVGNSRYFYTYLLLF